MSRYPNFAFLVGGGVKWHFKNLKSRFEDLTRYTKFYNFWGKGIKWHLCQVGVTWHILTLTLAHSQNRVLHSSLSRFSHVPQKS